MRVSLMTSPQCLARILLLVDFAVSVVFADRMREETEIAMLQLHREDLCSDRWSCLHCRPLLDKINKWEKEFGMTPQLESA